MSGAITWEAKLFIQAILLGIILMILYDFLRIVRLIIPHRLIVISCEDLLYWIFNGFAVFRLLFMENNGIIRGFALAALFLGMLLYNKLVSPAIIKGAEKIIKYLNKLVKSLRMNGKKR